MITRTRAWTSLAASCLLAASTLAMAHHGVPGYDFSKPVELTGRIVEVSWKNPHVYFTIDTGTRDGGGKPRVLEIECDSPSLLVGHGMSRGLLKPGTRVNVLAFGRLKNPDGANYKGATATLPDGSVYYLQPTPMPALVRETIAAQALSGKWVPASVSNFLDYTRAEARARAGMPALAPATQADAAGAPPAIATSCARLAKNPLPFVMAATGGLRTIEIGKKAVVMRVDQEGGVLNRTIDLTQPAHQANLAPVPHGHSIGHWEGSTLVIDTAGFAPNPNMRLGARTHMIERLTLADDRRHVQYEFTVEDPDNYRMPFHYSMLWTYRPDLAMSGAKCDEKVAQKYLSVK